MSKQRRKDKNPWDRLMLWVHENQKVIMVVLLILVAPFFAFSVPVSQLFSKSAENTVIERVYGTPLTGLDLKSAADRLAAVATVAPGAYRTTQLTFPEATGQALRGEREGFDAINFFMFREKARKLGLRVSDDELSEHIRELWQEYEAASQAYDEVVKQKQKEKKSASDQQLGFEVFQARLRKLEELRANNAFDENAWVNLIRSKTRLRVSEIEETLRDVYLIGKLESYVNSSVKVSPEEVYKVYREEEQKRKFTWVELKSNDALRENVAKTLTADDVKAYYEGHKDLLKKPFPMIRASWLLLPKDHFKEEVGKKITDEDLKTYYQENRGQYRRTILADEAAFKPRTPEERQAFEQKLYLPLEEVKDKVRENVVEKKTDEELAAFDRQVSARLFPPKSDAGKTAPDKPATFEGLLKEFPFLKTGSTPYVSMEDAKAVFGDAYTFKVEEWLSRWRFGPPKTKLEDPNKSSRGAKGAVYYAKVQERPAGTLPPLKEIESEVSETFLKSQIADIVEKAAQGLLKDVAEGKKDLSAVVASGLDVQVAGAKVHVEAGPAESAKSFLEKEGSLKVPKPKKEEAAAKGAETKGSTEEGDEPLEKEELHPASQAILGAVFNIQEMKSLAVAKDPKTGNCYLVRFDDVVYPDPANFEKEKSRIEHDLLAGSRESGVGKEAKHFKAWRDEVMREALGRASKKSTES